MPQTAGNPAACKQLQAEVRLLICSPAAYVVPFLTAAVPRIGWQGKGEASNAMYYKGQVRRCKFGNRFTNRIRRACAPSL